jgi:hypothetical protein
MKSTTCREYRKKERGLSHNVMPAFCTLQWETPTNQSALPDFRAITDTKTLQNTSSTDAQMEKAMPAELLASHHCPAANMRTHTQNCTIIFENLWLSSSFITCWSVHLTPPCVRNTQMIPFPKRDEVGATAHARTHTISTTQSKQKHEICFLIGVSLNPWLTNKRNIGRNGNKAMKMETEQEN